MLLLHIVMQSFTDFLAMTTLVGTEYDRGEWREANGKRVCGMSFQ